MAFDWRKRKGQNPVPMFPTLGEGETLAIDEEVIDNIEGHMWAANVSVFGDPLPSSTYVLEGTLPELAHQLTDLP